MKPARNLRELARAITLDEGLKESVSIAQVAEILGVLGRRWRSADDLCHMKYILTREGREAHTLGYCEFGLIALRAGLRSAKRKPAKRAGVRGKGKK